VVDPIGEDMTTQVRGQQERKPARTPSRPERTTPVAFVREIRSELRKVIWPTRKELVTYTSVAVIFIMIMVGIVTGADYLFFKLVLKIFG
jgi:preprotein translocase subunit SecE